MNSKAIYKPLYENSWALVIGVNDYQTASPLGYAKQDAEAFADVLTSRYDFPQENVTILLDQDATRERIMSSFLRFSEKCVLPDDRVAVFFAGHGYTRTGKRGEVGFLVPVDGDPGNLLTLIRWDDLTRNSELIEAKHLLFVMDACYGGLAVHRSIPSGSSRFLKDMLQRYSRQVLTAGKADETVSDSGGPRPNHSLFTGHLLDALEGNAADSNGIISANAVMAYVYEHVAKDPSSQQSPHFGFFDGDGDFIFFSPPTPALDNQREKENSDVLVQVPPGYLPSDELTEERLLIKHVKDYLSDPQYRIRLDDLVATEIRTALYLIREQEFPVQTTAVTPAEFALRIRKYETLLSRLISVTILIAKWGTKEHQPLIEMIIARLADANGPRGGMTVWLGLRWYPIMLLIYSGGISALSSHNYMSLATLLTTKLGSRTSGHKSQEAVILTVEGMLDVDRVDLFKTIPGYERNYVPRSEYLFKTLQSGIEDLLFLGNSYEELFDRVEILYALIYADIEVRAGHHLWGPPGRFGWKRHNGRVDNPYAGVLEEAERNGLSWGPVASGLFAGSIDRFKEIALAYQDEILNRLPWF